MVKNPTKLPSPLVVLAVANFHFWPITALKTYYFFEKK